MKTLYIDCSMGVSARMLAGALLNVMPDQAVVLDEWNALQIPGVTFAADRTSCGVAGTQVSVKISDAQITALRGGCEQLDFDDFISRLVLPEKVKQDVLAVFEILSEAERSVYGEDHAEHDFQREKLIRTIAEVIAVCILMNRLSPERIAASAVPVGRGTVRTARGVLPVPTPATAYILRNVPVCGGLSVGEQCTAVAAALLRHFAVEFCEIPSMKISQIGYGMDGNDGAHSRFTRVMLGDCADSTDEILELSCNVDDMTGEEVGFALQEFLTAGALDAYTESISMKKSRPAVKICVVCREKDKDAMVSLLFRHTTTLGIREVRYKRYTLQREIRQIQTPYGLVRRKDSYGYGVSRSKYEYDDLAKIAKEKNLSIEEVLTVIRQS